MPAPPSPVPLLREQRGFAAGLVALVLLAGCATGAPPGGLFPGLRHAGPRPTRARPQPLEADASRASWSADASPSDTGAGPVTREQLHARMDRFHRLLVLRPDGYLVRPTTGEAMQKAGEVRLGGDGLPRAGGYAVGPFYAIEDGQLWPVDSELEVARDAVPLGLYVPDNGALMPALEGAGQALGDVVGGLLMAVVHPVDSLENLARLPGAVRELLQHAPEYRETFLRAPRGERVRLVARLTTHVLLTVGTAGEGAATAASWGNGLSRLSVPVLSLTREGALALRLVAIPGRTVAVAGEALSATYVLHMAAVGVVAAGPGPSWAPPVGGPGQWVPKNEAMSPRSRRFQHKVTKAPAGWVYRVFRNGEKADFDGLDPGASCRKPRAWVMTNILIQTSSPSGISRARSGWSDKPGGRATWPTESPSAGTWPSPGWSTSSRSSS